MHSTEQAVENAETALGKSRDIDKVLPARKRKKPKLIITVEIGDGRSGDIPFYEGDKSEDLAAAFVKRYELPTAVTNALQAHIENSVQKLEVQKTTGSRKTTTDKEKTLPRKSTGQSDTRRRSAGPPTHTAAAAQRRKKSSTSQRDSKKKKKKPVKKQTRKNKGGGDDVYMRLFSDATEKRDRLDRKHEGARQRRTREHEKFSFKPDLEPNSAGWENGEKEMKKYFSDMGFDANGLVSGQRRGDHHSAPLSSSEEKSVHNRLYSEGLHETKAKLNKARVRKKQLQHERDTWTCPACCHINSGANDFCVNHVKNGKKRVPVNKKEDGVWLENGSCLDRQDFSKFGGRSGGPVDRNRKVVQKTTWQCCGTARPAAFKPTVSKMAHRMVRTTKGFEYGGSPAQAANGQRKKRVGEKEVFEALYNPKAMSRKVFALAQQQEDKEMKECTFKPKISKRSAEIVAQKHGEYYYGYPSQAIAESKCHELYMDAKDRRVRQDKYVAQEVSRYTFKPDIGVNKIRENKRDGKGGESSGNGTESFFQRLHKSGQHRAKGLEELKRSATYDEKTGQPFFRPKTGRAPNYDRNSQGLPVHEFLFASRHEYDDKIRLMAQEKKLKMESMQNQQYISKKSTKLIDSMKQKRFLDMFNKLVNSTKAGSGVAAPVGKDELLDSSLVDVAVLEESTREIVGPILQQFDGTKLNRKEFFTLMDTILEDRSNGPIHSILARRRTKAVVLEETVDQIKKEETFHPNINKVSKVLASHRSSTTEPIFEVLNKERKRYKLNMEAERQRQIDEEMAECTFQPKLISKQIGDITGFTSVYSGTPPSLKTPGRN